MSLQAAAGKHGVVGCVDCDRCADVCPIRWADPRFSPAALARAYIENRSDLNDRALFTLRTCASCGACLARCPEPKPDFAGFVPAARAEALALGLDDDFPHRGALHRIMQLTALDGVNQRRLDWVPESLNRKVAPGGVLYFTGCAPFLDAALRPEFNAKGAATARAGLALLDCLGLEPGLMEREICCGHDFLMSGDVERFRRHAQALGRLIERSGASTVVCPCQECTHCLSEWYPAHGLPLKAAVVDLTEMVARNLHTLDLAPSGRTVAVHVEPGRGDDALRTARLSTVCKAVPETTVHALEPENGRPHSVGVRGFLSCGGWSAQLQDRLLQTAHQQGAGLVVSDCLKTGLHLACALRPGTWRRASVEATHVADFLMDHLIPTDARDRKH